MSTESEATQIDNSAEEINTWAFVEIMGHSKIAGRVTTRKLGTQVMFQIDVPKGESEFSHSKLYNPSSIFSIQPTSEQWCRKWAKAACEMQHDVLPYIPEARQLSNAVQDENDSEFDREERPE